jgi:hypothetical protein
MALSEGETAEHPDVVKYVRLDEIPTQPSITPFAYVSSQVEGWMVSDKCICPVLSHGKGASHSRDRLHVIQRIYLDRRSEILEHLVDLVTGLANNAG